MKATVNLLAGFALGVCLFSHVAWGADKPSAKPPTRGFAPAGASAGDAEKRAEAAKSLRLADDAMKDRNFKLAEYYIDRAEKLNVAYDPATAKFENTPETARKRLAELQAKSAGAAPASSAPPATRPAATDALTDDAKAKARLYLQRGRAALAQKDLVGAEGWYQQAVSTKAKFNASEYSPNNLADELRKHGVELKAPSATAGEFNANEAPPSDDRARSAADRLSPPPGGAFPAGGDFAEGSIDPRGIRHNDPAPVSGVPNRLPANDAAPVNQSEAFRLVAHAREALNRGDVDAARGLAQQADAFQIPDEAYAKDLIPWVILLDVDKAATRRRPDAARTGNVTPDREAADPRSKYPVAQGLYNRENDRTKNVRAAQESPLRQVGEGNEDGFRLFDAGMRALSAGQRDDALRLFNQAWEYQAELDPRTRQQLQDQMNALRTGAAKPLTGGRAPTPLEAADTEQQIVHQKLMREIQKEQSAAEKMRASDPRGALERLKKLRDRIRQTQLDPQAQKQLLVIADRSVLDTERYIELNLGQIELDEQNRDVRNDVDRDRLRVIEIQHKIAQLVEEFNQLIDQQRYAEAEVLAKQANAIDPESPVVQTLVEKARFVRRIESQMAIRDQKERSFYDTMESVDRASEPFDDSKPYRHSDDIKWWNQITGNRKNMMERYKTRLSPEEREIQQSLKSKVRVEFTETPLAVALDTLGRRVGINIVLDPQGLAAEGITSDTPVTLNLSQEISLKSALDLILQPLRLSHVIQHEVLKVTSEQARSSNVYVVAYNVGDLVIPIPNFVPGYNVGLPAALRDAYNTLGYGGSAPVTGNVPLSVASNETGAAGNASILAQMGAPGMAGAFRSPNLRQPHSAGPGGLGGGMQADFDTLIDLVTATIAPTTWDDNGGAGSIQGFETNLSLVVSQTQDVHEQIADLLEQLRRLQDLQVTIEVRFIALQDDFFERIGVQFDFAINDNSNIQTVTANNVTTFVDNNNPSAVVGLQAPVAGIPNPTGTLDLDFRQGGFASAVPQFGGFDANTAANFGFAILSDIEVFFFLQASQGDTRTNVLQAPKVTLFNGQQATISDTSQTPFVTSIIPVVGDFAAAHQPVIVVLNEGTSLSVQAVVSNDKRFVRLTLVPFFSQIGEVKEFTFNGRTTTRTGTAVTDPANPGNILGRNNEERITEGTTVQLPTFAFTTVTTTVSVPDGGTVLLGGIKRLSEGRNERGVPLLSKVPYVNRLFKNVGIGRTTRSLMMMVTPRIIIQEEEEERSVGRPLTP